MPRKQLNCCQVVKELCLTHRYCSKTRNTPKLYSGSTLCSFIGDSENVRLKNDEEYRVCWELSKTINRYLIANPERKKRVSTINLENVKRVKLFVGGVGGDVINVDLDGEKRNRRTKSEVICQDLQEKSAKYRFQYSSLSMRERNRRVSFLAEEVLASCINISELKRSGSNYIQRNKDLLIDVVTVMDMVKLKLEHMMKMRLSSAGDEITLPPSNDKVLKLAKSMLAETTRSSYDRLRKEFNVLDMSESKFPSYYSITKGSRPTIIPFDINNVRVDTTLEDIGITAMSTENINDTGATHTVQPQLQLIRTPKSYINRTDITVKDAFENIKRSKESESKANIKTARIKGTFKDYIKLIVDSYTNRGVTLDDELIVMDSYDGAEHRSTSNKRISIISFSSQIISRSLIESAKASPASSLNILTWQQLVGEEKAMNLFPALMDMYACKHEMRRNNGVVLSIPNKRVVFYDLHDGKMLYILTQHSLFNRKHHPFLLCKCQRGAGVANANHICEPISHDEQIQRYERSERRWNIKRERVGESAYVKKDHMDWIDKENIGISHFGLHPNLLPRHLIRFDVFHLRCAITRRIMSNLRKFLYGSNMDIEVSERFSDILSVFWSDYNVLLWNLNKKFQSLTGSELLAFVKNVSKIVIFLTKEFQPSEVLDDVCNGLLLWESITPFLVITKIDNNYAQKLDEFE